MDPISQAIAGGIGGLYGYNSEANNQASGYGPSLVVYVDSGFPEGGLQVNLDASTTDISPETIIEAIKDPQWLLVLGVAIMIFVLARNK